jgi:hypothetical protein
MGWNHEMPHNRDTERFEMRLTLGMLLALCVFLGLAVFLGRVLFEIAKGVGA